MKLEDAQIYQIIVTPLVADVVMLNYNQSFGRQYLSLCVCS